MAMTAVNIRLDEVDDDGVDSSTSPEDHLATTKMPAIGQRASFPPARFPSAPPSPPPIVSGPAGASSQTIPPPPLTVGGPLPSMPPPLFPLAGERASSDAPAPLIPAAESPRAAPTSWWRALLASAVPPAPEAGVASALPHALRLRLAAVAVGLGLLAFVVAFAVGFQGPPADC
jgi:hypothetical protein